MVDGKNSIERLATIEHPFDYYLDIIAVLIWLAATVLCISIPPLSETSLRVIFALPTILFIPGYVLIATLFPRREDLDLLERIALSFGLSIAVVPLIGLALNYTPWGIRLEPVVSTLIIYIALFTVAATMRRATVDPDQRFKLPLERIVWGIRQMVAPEGNSGLDRALSILLFVAIIIAVAATIYVIVVPKEGEKFTEFYILGENGKAADYPSTLLLGNVYGVIIGIGNHEYRNITYTVECYAVNMTFNTTTNTSSLHAMERLDWFTLMVPHNNTVERRWIFPSPQTGYNRVEFLLFNETVPSNEVVGAERIAASYRDLHLWVEIRSQ